MYLNEFVYGHILQTKQLYLLYNIVIKLPN